MSAGAARERLRAATAEAHRRLDARIEATTLGDPEVYARFLIGHARVVAPTEAAMERAAVARLLPDWPVRRRTEALAGDLEAMGLAPPEPIVAPALGEEASVWGALYVLEGSRLGAQVLLRRVEASGSSRVRGAAAYLAHGRGQRLWSSFLTGLEASAAMRARPEAGEAAALLLFQAFADALEQASA